MKVLENKKDRIILFDLDGTLIDSTEAILESFTVAFEHFGEKVPSAEMIKGQIGYPLEDMFLSMGVPPLSIDRYVQAYKAHYRQISCQKTVLLEQAREAIILASEHAILGVVTTKTGAYSIELLEYMGLMSYFDVLVGREDVTFPKPNPEPIEKALYQLPKVTSGIWMVGDTCMDMEAASSANIDGIAVLCGYGTYGQLSSCTVTVVENSYQAVLKIIAKQ